MDILGLFKNIKITNYHAYLMLLSGIILILSLTYDLKILNNLMVATISILVLLCSIFVWVLDQLMQHIANHFYENSIQEGKDLRADKKNVRLRYNKRAFILSIINGIIQLSLWIGISIYRYFKIVENIIKTEESRNDLIEAKILISGKYRDEQGNAQDGYSLGANALPLVSAWNNEELAKDTRNFTKSINNLTIWLLFLTGITVLLTA